MRLDRGIASGDHERPQRLIRSLLDRMIRPAHRHGVNFRPEQAFGATT
jgi:hypothetical protein